MSIGAELWYFFGGYLCDGVLCNFLGGLVNFLFLPSPWRKVGVETLVEVLY
jgi:hypothetical protein